MKTKELKGIPNPGTYDEIMRMLKWFNVKSREHDQWIIGRFKFAAI
jgi:hypothetical protein